MKVALVCPYALDVPGGVQAHVQQLADHLPLLGDDVFVLAPGPRDPFGGASVGRPFGVPFNGSVAPVALSPLAGRRVVAQLARFAPDVVHVHEPAAPVTSLAACLWGPTPIVGTFHSWAERASLYRGARVLVRKAAARLSIRIAVSAPAIEHHARVLGLPAGSFREVPNGVDVARFANASPLPELTRTGRPTVVFVGRLEQRKGVEELVRAFVQVKARRPTLRLVVVGEGPERDRCQALLPARLRADAVFVGRVDADDLPRFYASADVVAAPALGGESFGIVLLEAMASGVPVIASSIPGYRSVLRDGVDGRLVPPGDVRALADGLDVLLDNAVLRAAMGAEGRRAAAAYDWPVVTQQLRGLYLAAVMRP